MKDVNSIKLGSTFKLMINMPLAEEDEKTKFGRSIAQISAQPEPEKDQWAGLYN